MSAAGSARVRSGARPRRRSRRVGSLVSHPWPAQKEEAERSASRCRLKVAAARPLHWPVNHVVSRLTLSSSSSSATSNRVPGGASSAARARRVDR
jgi:hypothetical protein